MEERNSLPRGREFELHLFGKTDVADKSLRRLDFHSAMQGVTTKPLARMNSNGYPEVYNPVRPNWGMTPQLWSSVKKHLPRWHKGEKSNPLLLYISVGTSLDCHHGVDCFFWWKGAYCLIDASLILKHKDGQGKENLRADVLLHPHHLRGATFFQVVGGCVASPSTVIPFPGMPR